ncbi:MAG: hypothetical protein ACI4BI_06880, partial [Anaerotardibacter sp.]
MDIYSKIGAKVFELTSQKKQEWENAKRIVDETHTLSEEEIEEKKRKIAELETKQKELKAAIDIDCTKSDWIKTESKLAHDVAMAKENLRKATENVESEEFKKKELRVKDWYATIEARQWMVDTKNAKELQLRQKKTLEQLAIQFSAILGGQKHAEMEAKEIAEKIKIIDKFLDSENDKSVVYENTQTIEGLLTTISDGRIAIAKCNGDIENENKSLSKILIPAHESSISNAKSAKESLEKEEAEVRKQEEEVTALNLQELRKQYVVAKELLGNIATAKERIETLATAKDRKETLRKRLAEQFSTINEKRQMASEMIGPIHDAEIKMNERKECLDKQKDTIDKFASTLRLKLRRGDTCPVCCQKIENDLPHEEYLSVLISGLQNAYDDAEKQHNYLVQEKTKLDAEIKTESNAYERDLKEFNEEKSVASSEQKAQEACKVCGIDKLDGTTLSHLDALEVSTNSLKAELDTRIKEGETRENAVKKMRTGLDLKRKKLETLLEKVQNTEKAVNECKARINTAQTLVSTKKREVEMAEQKVRGLIAGSWNIDWNDSPKEFSEALAQATKTYNSSLQKKQTLISKQNTLETNNKNIASVVDSILEAMPDWKNLEVSDNSQIVNLLDKANG